MEDRRVSMIVRDNAAFVAIDFQEKLMPVMSGAQKLEEKTVKLIKGTEGSGNTGHRNTAVHQGNRSDDTFRG